jgi:hypothetical protein
MTTTNYLSSASAVEVINNQPREEPITMTTAIPTINQTKENAITTITELKAYIQFTPDMEVNKRLKVAQMAKQFNTNRGVFHAAVGTLNYHFNTKVRGTATSRSEVVEVCYVEDCELVNKAAGFKLFIRRAWFNKDEVVGVEFSLIGEEATHVMFQQGFFLDFIGEQKSLTVDGEELCQREMRELIHAYLGNDGDQYGQAQKAIAERQREEARRAEHEAKIQAAYAGRESSGGYWRNAWVLEKAHGGLAAADHDGWKQHHEALKQAYKALEDIYQVELWAVVESSLGKLRCETNITNEDDPYGFVTMAEVAYYILTKWCNNGYWDSKEMRQVIAAEFVRKHLS